MACVCCQFLPCSEGFSAGSHVILQDLKLFFGISRFSLGSHVFLRHLKLFCGISRFSAGSQAFLRDLTFFCGISSFSAGSQIFLQDLRLFCRISGFSAGSQVLLPAQKPRFPNSYLTRIKHDDFGVNWYRMVIMTHQTLSLEKYWKL